MSTIRKKRNSRVKRRRTPVVERKPLPWRPIAAGGLGLLAIAAATLGLGQLLDRPVSISVSGSGQRVSEMEVRSVLAGFDQSGFLSVDLDAVRAAAESLSWVDRARVEREFPARLRITITEQVAAARWGASGLLNTRGELFVTAARFGLPELPALSGPDGSQWRVAQRYLEIHRLATPLGFDVRSLRLGARGAWDIELASGLQIRLGRKDTERRLQRLAEVVAPRIQDIQERVEYVDMRYGNGFVIGWKSGEAPAAKTEGAQRVGSRRGLSGPFARRSSGNGFSTAQIRREPI